MLNHHTYTSAKAFNLHCTLLYMLTLLYKSACFIVSKSVGYTINASTIIFHSMQPHKQLRLTESPLFKCM